MELIHTWALFLELNSARSYNGFGPNPLTYTEILSWSQLMRTDLAPWEVETLKSLDRLWLETVGSGK